MDRIDAFKLLSKVFFDNGFSLYLVGGTVRDYLLKKELTDLDVVTNATPEEIKKFLGGDFTFAKYGFVKIEFNGYKFDVITLRKEKRYKDFRHPNNIKFVKSLRKDVKRRDFTINGIYMDDNLKIYDYVNGLRDLNNKTIKTIGNPYRRIKEDPLRIIRAVRFASTLDFKLDPKLIKAIKVYADLLKKISKDKIKQEISKVKIKDIIKFNKILREIAIYHLIDMIK